MCLSGLKAAPNQVIYFFLTPTRLQLAILSFVVSAYRSLAHFAAKLMPGYNHNLYKTGPAKDKFSVLSCV